jgi:CHAT domain-containing protein
VGDPFGEWGARAGLASAYRQSRRWADADSQYRHAIGIIERERSKLAQDDLRLTFLSSLIRFYQDYVDFLMERGQPERAFEVARASRARVLSEKLKTVQPVAQPPLRNLAANTRTVIASYWLAPKRSFLWVIDGSGLRSFVLPPQSEIASRVARWRKAILDGDRPEETEAETGAWLYANLVSNHFAVPPGQELLVMADGSLFELNLETLPSGKGRYWIEEVKMAVAPALSLVKVWRPSSIDRLLLIGDPDFESDEFPRLAHLASEVEAVSSHFGKKDVYRGSAATPAAYRTASASEYSTVHLAAHAVANRESPLDSAVILAGGEDSHKLYARDVMNRPLRADLVTLSACQSAGNKTYAGEGLTGLAWAFLSAGARHVVAGLWDVDDRATSKLMAGLYESLRRGEPPALALRSAKLALMEANRVYRKPRYWAAFQTFTNAVYDSEAKPSSGLKRPPADVHYRAGNARLPR